MSGRNAARLAWGLAVISLLLLLLGAVLYAANTDVTATDAALEAVFLAFVAVFGVVGALIASRHPRNAIGWIFCGVAVAVGLSDLASGYAELWLAGGVAVAVLGETAAWYANSSWIPIVFLAPTFVVMLFPDGRLLSRRWRPVAWCAAVGIPAEFAGSALGPGPLQDYPGLTNPYAVDNPLVETLEPIGLLLVFSAVIASVVSLVVRFRRAGHEQRQQIKWLAWAGALAAVILIANILGYELVGETVANTLILLSVLGLPLAAGVAIPPLPPLRHRRRHQPHARLRCADRHAGRGVSGQCVVAADCPEWGDRGVGVGGGGLDGGGGGAVPSGTGAYPGGRGPPLLSPQVRRPANARGVLRAAPQRGGPRGA